MSQNKYYNKRKTQNHKPERKRNSRAAASSLKPIEVKKITQEAHGIEVIPCGESASGVTGSCTLVRNPSVQFLIECGLYQESGHPIRQYKVNSADFPFDPKQLSFVIVGHCHGDHILRIPLLFKRGFRGKVFMPEGSEQIAKILFDDCANIAIRDVKDIKKRLGTTVEPLYDASDVEETMKNIVEVPFGRWTKVHEDVEFCYTPSGHILNAAQIEIQISHNGKRRKIAYTSDLGNTHIKKDYVQPFCPIKDADLFIGETTYAGERLIASQQARNIDIEKMREVIEEVCVINKKKLLIPAFANSRSQEILTCLYDMYHDDPNFHIPIIYDSPMGNLVCKAYLDILEGEAHDKFWEVSNWSHIRFIENSFESEAWRKDHHPAIIIASSGMLDFGRSHAYACDLLKQDEACIMFCGYTVKDSFAGRIRAEKEAQLLGLEFNKEREVRCRIETLSSFSSHMQDDDLLKYYSDIKCGKIILLHGEPKMQRPFIERLEAERERKGNSCPVVLTHKNQIIRI